MRRDVEPTATVRSTEVSAFPTADRPTPYVVVMAYILKCVIFAIGLVAAAGSSILIGLDEPESVAWSPPSAPVETADFDPMIRAAISDYEANDALADSAPQQQVTNGWVARDLLRTIATQIEAQSDTLDGLGAAVTEAAVPPSPVDDRAVRLLVVLVLTVCWIALWRLLPKRPVSGHAAESANGAFASAALTPPPPPAVSSER